MRRPDDTPAPRPPAAAFPGLTEAQRAALSDASAAALAGTVRSASGSGAPDLEARVRSLAQRHGYALRRSRTRDPRGPDFGADYFVDPRTNARVGPDGRDGLCLKEAEEWLATRGPARPPGAAAARVRPCATPPPTAAIAAPGGGALGATVRARRRELGWSQAEHLQRFNTGISSVRRQFSPADCLAPDEEPEKLWQEYREMYEACLKSGGGTSMAPFAFIMVIELLS